MTDWLTDRLTECLIKSSIEVWSVQVLGHHEGMFLHTEAFLNTTLMNWLVGCLAAWLIDQLTD